MVSFQTKIPNLGKFWRAIDGKMLIYFRAILNSLLLFGIFYDHLVHFVFIWYIFPVLVSCTYIEPILQLSNLQLQHQRCRRLQRFSKWNKIFLFSKRVRLPVAL
jgi:hypothetical protein